MRSTGRTGRTGRWTRVGGFVGMCVACVVMPCLSWAQDHTTARTVQLSAITALDDIVVTTTRTEERLSQTGQAVTVIGRDELRQRQESDVLEELRDIPGFAVVQQGSRGSTASVFVRGGESDHNLVLIDGMKANVPGGTFDFGDVSLLGVERIEVVRGPHSALYGSDAMSSVVQLFTPRGHGTPQGFLRFRGGHHNTLEEQAGFSGGTDLYGYYLAVERVDTNGTQPINSDYSNTSLAARFDLDPLDKVQIMLPVRYHDSRYHFSTGGSGDRFERRNGTLDAHQYSDRRRVQLGPRARYSPTNWWRHTLQLGYLREWRTFRDPFDANTDFGSFVSNSSERRLSLDYASDFFLPGLWSLEPTFTIGGYVEDEHFSQKANAAGAIDRVNPSRNAQAVYTQLLLAWQEQLFVTSGFRLDDSSVYGTHVNPRVSVAYIMPGLGTKLRGSYGEGLKAPTFIENFGTGSPFTLGNRNLAPEQSQSWEFGLEQPFSLATFATELSLTYFSTEYKNLVAFVFAPHTNFLNVQRARSRGLELGLRAVVTDQFSVRGAYTYLETRVLDAGDSGGASFVTGQALLRRPEHIGSLTLNYGYQRLNANLNISLKGHAADVQFKPDFSSQRVRNSGYARIDLALAYRLLENQCGLRSLTLESRVRNLLNEDYEEVFGFSTPGATVLVGLRAEF